MANIGDEMDTPSVGDLAVWYIYNMPRTPALLPVNTPAEAQNMIVALSSAMLMTAAIVSNVFGLVRWDNDEWTEWEDEETGDQIDDWSE